MADTQVSKIIRRLFGKKMKFTDFSVSDDRIFLQKEHKCPSCSAHLDADQLKQNMYVCPQCGHHFRISAPERLRFLADGGEYQEFSDEPEKTSNPLGFSGLRRKSQRNRTENRIERGCADRGLQD